MRATTGIEAPAMDLTRSEEIVEVREERYFSPHHLLLRAAGASVMAAQGSNVRGREIHILNAMVMSALSIEALCNAIGYRVLIGWKDFEQVPAWAKIRLICAALHIDFDKGMSPWQQLQTLLSFRNAIAHGKTEKVSVSRKLSVDEYQKSVVNRLCEPLSKFEQGLTIQNARLSLACARMVEDLLTSHLPDEHQMGLLVEGWTHSVVKV